MNKYGQQVEISFRTTLRFVDFEADLILGKAQKFALLAKTERATLKTTIAKLKGKHPVQVAKTMINRMKKMPALKAISFPNNQAFGLYESD